jgi:uncharacterized protein (DUF362 family)
MRRLSRREFLRLAATGSGALALSEFLAACGVEDLTAAPTALPSQTALPPTMTSSPMPPTATPAELAQNEPTQAASETPDPTATETAVPAPDLVVVHNGDPETMVRRAIAAMGGMEKFVPKGSNVIIKPNICVDFRTYEWAATTNPWVVGALVKLAFEAGAGRVRVMDQTWKRGMTEAYLTSGIQEQVEAAGGEMEWMPVEKFVPYDIPQGVELKSWNIYDEIMNADVLINVPIAKHHANAKLTLAMKNLMGVIDNRPDIHDAAAGTFGAKFGQRIADLTSIIRPTLNVMDAVRMMMNNGPIGFALSDVKQMDTVIVSQDIVAIDSYTATLFEMKPADLDYVVCATAMGLGRSDLENLRIEEFNVS